MPTKAQLAEQEEAREELRALLHPGDTIFTSVRHVSRSGMSRVIDLRVIRDNDPLRITWSAAEAVGWRYDRNHEGIVVGGCGMDMGFHAVYTLAQVLWPDGFSCIGRGESRGQECPSNDHGNARREDGGYAGSFNGTPHHRDGGYALKQRWL